MKVIGHRGAAGLALENTLESIKAAIATGVDAVEFDVRLTADGHFVLCHDDSVSRVSKHTHSIKDVAAEHLGSVILHNGEKLPTLAEALDVAGNTPVIIETKGSHWAKPMAEFLNGRKVKTASVISFDHDELTAFRKLAPNVPTYSVEKTRPFEVIQFAKQNHFTGVDFNFWLLNPLTYWLARRRNLEIVVYTVNSKWIAAFLSVLYPRLAITTDKPHQMQFLRRRHKQLAKETTST